MLNRVKRRLRIFFKSWIFLNFHNDKNWLKRTESDAVTGYLKNRNSQSNIFLQELIENIKWDSLVEVGSNCGNRILEIANLNPNKIIYGLDINLPAVSLGNSVAKEENITNIEFFQVDLRSSQFSQFITKKTPDCLLSWATLICVHPLYIKRFFQTVCNSSIKTIILIEQHESKLKTGLTFRGVVSGGSGNWKRNYVKIIQRYSADPWSIKIMDVPPSVWNPGGGHGRVLLARKLS